MKVYIAKSENLMARQSLTFTCEKIQCLILMKDTFNIFNFLVVTNRLYEVSPNHKLVSCTTTYKIFNIFS